MESISSASNLEVHIDEKKSIDLSQLLDAMGDDKDQTKEPLRLHIRAWINSDSEEEITNS